MQLALPDELVGDRDAEEHALVPLRLVEISIRPSPLLRRSSMDGLGLAL
jgi:hypothetical protein